MRASSFVLVLALGACGGGAPRLEPGSGSVRGGDDVRIVGEGFSGHGALVVAFADIPARAVVIESDTLVRVKAPAVPEPALVDVSLAFADGTTLQLPAAFEYVAGQGVVIAPGAN